MQRLKFAMSKKNHKGPFYVNPDDPRVFIYKFREAKYLGVGLNFFWSKSIFLYATTVAGNLLLLILSVFFPAGGITTLLCWLILWQIYYFRNARKDLEKHPGSPYPRD